MIIRLAEHVITAVSPLQYPGTGVPEVAMAGRSNVGKSSVINSLVNRKGLARVGQTPGKTKLINFYNINNEMMLVDLPGYGYAKVSKEERKSWGALAETYLNSRETLKLVLLLVDIRHDPSDFDHMMVEWLSGMECPFIVVANKADKLGRMQVIQHVANIRRELDLRDDIVVLPFSAEKKTGVEALWEEISKGL